MTRARLMTAAFAAAVMLFTIVTLPPARLHTDTSWRDATVAGVLHIHSNRSDGRSSPGTIAAAAARAGLSFIVLTDHGDATHLDPPIYRSGVLCIDAVEISTNGGHYLALGLGDVPYPLGGEPADVVEDVHRLGGMGIAAHPDSPKDALQWHDWTAPLDGVELINPDTSWRRRVFATPWRSPWLITQSLFTYPFRAPQTMARLLTASPDLVERWSGMLNERRVVAVVGTDAHAKLELRNAEPGDNRSSLPLPGYEPSFELLSVHVAPEAPLTGNAQADAAAILAAIRSGHVYAAVDAWAAPPAFEFTASNAAGTAQQGDLLAPAGPLTLHVKSNAPDGFDTIVWRGNSEIARRRGERDISIAANETDGVYRVEIRRPDSLDSPAWITSNPIYVRAGNGDADGVVQRDRAQAAAPTIPSGATPLIAAGNANGWTTESDPTSLAAVGPVALEAGPAIAIRFGLSGGVRQHQFAGGAVELPAELQQIQRLSLVARSDQPMRVSVQLRAASARQERWQKSLYLNEGERTFTLSPDDFIPVGDAPSAIPAIRYILFIVDTTNTRPGGSGRIWLRDVRVEKK